MELDNIARQDRGIPTHVLHHTGPGLEFPLHVKFAMHPIVTKGCTPLFKILTQGYVY